MKQIFYHQITTDKIHKHRMQYKTRDCFGSSCVANSRIWRTIPASSRNPQTIFEIPMRNDWAHHLSNLNLSTNKHFWTNMYSIPTPATAHLKYSTICFHCHVINITERLVEFCNSMHAKIWQNCPNSHKSQWFSPQNFSFAHLPCAYLAVFTSLLIHNNQYSSTSCFIVRLKITNTQHWDTVIRHNKQNLYDFAHNLTSLAQNFCKISKYGEQ